MYNDRKLIREIENYLGYTIGNLTAAKKMLRNKRPAHDVFCQLKSGKANLDKNVLENFFDANRLDLNERINRLLQNKNLDQQSAETLTGIQKQISKADMKQLKCFSKTVSKIEQLFFWLLVLQTDFFDLLLQNPLGAFLS